MDIRLYFIVAMLIMAMVASYRAGYNTGRQSMRKFLDCQHHWAATAEDPADFWNPASPDYLRKKCTHCGVTLKDSTPTVVRSS